MRMINKKYLLIILLVGVILTGVIIMRSKEESKLYEVKLQNDNKNDLAIMLEQLDSSYKEYNKIPYKGYSLNTEMTKCIDNNGNEVDEDITYENGKITISTDRTIYCYLYFDRQDEIEDLSGNNHNGINNAQIWTEEGITTSIDTNNLGYVDCGLAKYDFKDSITMITRLKFSDFTGGQDLFGNWDTAGGGLYINGSSLRFELYIDASYKMRIITYNFSLNTYYTLVGVYDGKEISIYIDGEKIGNIQITGNIKVSSLPIYLGANPEPSNLKPMMYSYTTFTDALIFDSALSEEEIQENFSGEIDKDKVIAKYVNNESEQNLLLFYKFD